MKNTFKKLLLGLILSAAPLSAPITTPFFSAVPLIVGSTIVTVDAYASYRPYTTTAFVAYTPTFTGFGTVTVSDFWWRRVGDSIEIQGVFTTGTTTATEGRISLPNSYSSDTTKVPAIRRVGSFTTGSQSLDPVDTLALVESNVAYMTFGYRNAGATPIQKRLGSDISANSKVVTVIATIPISGLTP